MDMVLTLAVKSSGVYVLEDLVFTFQGKEWDPPPQPLQLFPSHLLTHLMCVLYI